MIVVRKCNTNTTPKLPIRTATAQELVDYNKIVRNISENAMLASKNTDHYFKLTSTGNAEGTSFLFTK